MPDNGLSVRQLIEDMRGLFPETFTPKYEDAWAPVYAAALKDFEGQRLGRAWKGLKERWKYRHAPRPGDLVDACENTSGRRMYGDLSDEDLRAKTTLYREKFEEKNIGEYGLRKLEEEMSRRGLVDATP